MDELNINHILKRTQQEQTIIQCLEYFEAHKSEVLTKRGVYVYGSPGSGKTYFVREVLKRLDYDIISFDAGDVRNKSIIDTMTKHNMSSANVVSLLGRKARKIAIIMDEVDGMNSGDKGGINSLIKLIRPKKTKKQKKEDTTMVPIICIGSYHVDKKVKEMRKVCTAIELPNPTNSQIKDIIRLLMPDLSGTLLKNVVHFIQGDLRKLKSTYEIYKNQQSILKNKIIQNLFAPKTYSEDTKVIAKNLLTNKYNIGDHMLLMNETDRTSVGLLFHENVIDPLSTHPAEIAVPLYMRLLENLCFADYIDRLTFQRQIWIFNEMSSLVKTLFNNKIYHESLGDGVAPYDPTDVRFTKVLTKYSTEYNNMLFTQGLCFELNMDRKDMFSFFLDLRNKFGPNVYDKFNENYDITKLDINRIYRYLDKYTVPV